MNKYYLDFLKHMCIVPLFFFVEIHECGKMNRIQKVYYTIHSLKTFFSEGIHSAVPSGTYSRKYMSTTKCINHVYKGQAWTGTSEPLFPDNTLLFDDFPFNVFGRLVFLGLDLGDFSLADPDREVAVLVF